MFEKRGDTLNVNCRVNNFQVRYKIHFSELISSEILAMNPASHENLTSTELTKLLISLKSTLIFGWKIQF